MNREMIYDLESLSPLFDPHVLYLPLAFFVLVHCTLLALCSTVVQKVTLRPICILIP